MTRPRARSELGWTPTIDGLQLAKLMVEADVEALSHEGRPWIDTVKLDSWEGKKNAALKVDA